MASIAYTTEPEFQARGVHFVGSIRLPHETNDDPLIDPPSAKAVFQTLSDALPGRLRRIPDGETGIRHYFIKWQDRVFAPCPWILADQDHTAKSDSPLEDDNSHEDDFKAAAARKIELGAAGYDEYAIDSYRAFAALQDAGKISANTRFLVCIPTPINAIGWFVRPEFRAQVEPLYAARLREAIRNIQAVVPPAKLAIQFDCAVDFAVLERVPGPGGAWAPWFEPAPRALVDRIADVAREVAPAAELGFHLCYGDLGHRHFVEPRDTANLVAVANVIAERVAHPVAFVHLPVPKARDDDAYFAPLRDLRLSADTELYLGLVHAHDLDGTERRIGAARKAVPRFGVATECGLGRTPVSDVASIFDILKRVSQPVWSDGARRVA